MVKLVGLQFEFKYKKEVGNGVAHSLPVDYLIVDALVSSCHPDWLQEVFHTYNNAKSLPHNFCKLWLSNHQVTDVCLLGARLN
jgi:hypothetical protein